MYFTRVVCAIWQTGWIATSFRRARALGPWFESVQKFETATTSRESDLLNVSRPHLVKLLETPRIVQLPTRGRHQGVARVPRAMDRANAPGQSRTMPVNMAGKNDTAATSRKCVPPRQAIHPPGRRKRRFESRNQPCGA